MFFNSQKFHYVSYSSSLSSNVTNVYVNPDLEIINPTNNVLDLGIFMSGDCSFEFHIKNVCKKCTNLSGWILRTFYFMLNIKLDNVFNYKYFHKYKIS